MTIVCPECANSNPPDHLYCHQCGAGLAAGQGPRLPERSGAGPQRPPDESRLPPAGSFRSGVYRLARALLVSQGPSPATRQPRPMRRAEPQVAAGPPPAARKPDPAKPASIPATSAEDNLALPDRTGPPLAAATYWLTRAVLVRSTLATGQGRAARLPPPLAPGLPQRAPPGEAAPGLRKRWKVPPGLSEQVHSGAREAGRLAERAREVVTPSADVAVPRYVEVAAVALLTLVALLLRTWDLSGSPAGIHGDETELALEAIRSIETGGLGIWSGVVLGHPAGYAHWMAVLFRLGGTDVTTMRLASAIPGVLLVPVGYLLVRSLFPFRVSLVTAALLVFSLWFVIQSRIAFGGITAVFMAVLAMWLLVATVQSRRWWVGVAAGVALGLGLYTFKTFLIYFAGTWGVALLAMVVNREARGCRELWLALAISVLVGGPMLLFYANSGFIGPNLRDLYHVSLTDPSTWSGIPEQAVHALSLVHRPVDAYSTDGPPAIPVVPLLAALVSWVGLAVAFLHIHQRRYQLLLAGWLVGMAPVLLVPGVESRRYLLGILFVLVVVAIGVDALLVPFSRSASRFLARQAWTARTAGMVAGIGAAVLAVAFLALFSTQNVRELDRWRDSGSVRWFFNHEYITTLRFLDETGVGVKDEVRLYSARHIFDSSMRRFLLPDAVGTDGGREYGGEGVIPPPESIGSDTVFVFMDDYLPLAGVLQVENPAAVKLGEGVEDGQLVFVAFVVPATGTAETAQ